jgi:hypothetical protein
MSAQQNQQDESLEDSSTEPLSGKQSDRRSGKAFLQTVTLGDLVKWRDGGKRFRLLASQTNKQKKKKLLEPFNVLSVLVNYF